MTNLDRLRSYVDEHSIAQLARDVGCRPQSISCWLRAGYVPPRRVPKVSAITGIPPHHLNSESHPA